MTEFSFQGGRAGSISADIGGRTAQMEWEMLVGELDFVVYRSSAVWLDSEAIEMSESEKDFFLAEFDRWARSKKFNYEVA